MLYLYGDLQFILKFRKNRYTVNSQTRFDFVEHSDLSTLKKYELSNTLKKKGREELVSDVTKEVILPFTYFVHFGIILRNR